MTMHLAKTYTWDLEHEPPQEYQDLLEEMRYAFQLTTPQEIIEGRAETWTISGQAVRLTSALINVSPKQGGHPLAQKFIYQPQMTVINTPTIIFNLPRKETP